MPPDALAAGQIGMLTPDASDVYTASIRCMTRTTLDLDDGVLRALKARRARENKPMGVIASELLARALDQEPTPADDLRWISRSMGAKVDLEDRDALWAALDGD